SRILIVVLFPEPFGPRRPKISPLRTWNVTSSTALTRDRIQKSLNTLLRCSTSTTRSRAAPVSRASDITPATCVIQLLLFPDPQSEIHNPKSEIPLVLHPLGRGPLQRPVIDVL